MEEYKKKATDEGQPGQGYFTTVQAMKAFNADFWMQNTAGNGS